MDNIDQAIELRFVPVYMAFGSQATKAASDQVDSVSQAYRDGGNMLWLNEIGKAGFSPTVETFMEVFPDMYDLSDNTKLPSYIGSNHYKGKVQKKCVLLLHFLYTYFPVMITLITASYTIIHRFCERSKEGNRLEGGLSNKPDT